MFENNTSSRRAFVHFSTIAATSLLITAPGCATTDHKPREPREQEEEVAPGEDLMREHGVLKRIMLIYDEIAGRIDRKQDFSPDDLARSAKLIRDFVEDYHEKLEENYLFPRFQKANKLLDLVQTLRRQHDAGRRVTDIILQRATASAMNTVDDRATIADAIRRFNRMYAPHEAREDTVLFPAFHTVVSRNEYDSLGEDFEKQENQKFGAGGFEHVVDQVATIEKSLGIYDLAQFTPRV